MDSMNEERTGVYDSFCNDVNINTEKYIFDFKTKCRSACSYLNQIYAEYPPKQELKREACIYMYYWIYHNILKEEGKDIEKIYNAILKKYNEYDDDHFKDFIYISITEEKLKKLKYIYEMNTNLDNITNKNKSCTEEQKICECAKQCSALYIQQKDECKYYNNKDFCNALENIRDRYNTQMKNIKCDDGTPQLLPSFQKFSTITLILTTFIVIIVISIFIVILYKSIFESYLRNIIMRKRKQREDIYNGCIILQPSELSSSISRNRKYNILYYSE